MHFTKKTLSNIDLKDARVVMRADYNVPIEDGKIIDDYRIQQSVKTLRALSEQGAKVVVMSHLGRPKGKVDLQFSLRPVAERLSELFDQEVLFAEDCIGDKTLAQVHDMEPGQVLLLENLRFHYEEEIDDEDFAAQLARYGDVFVQDGFGVVHREHASTHAITKLLPSVAGLLLENEIKQISRAVDHPKKPFVAIVGGAKIKTKIELLDNIMTKTDRLIIGGAMSNTFLKAMGMEIGKSLCDDDELDVAKKVMAECRRTGIQLLLPLLDVAVSNTVSDDAVRRDIATEDIQPDDIILDFGPQSLESVKENLKDAGTVVWNGPLGMIEIPAFMQASEAVARYIVENKIDSVVGGGDTVELINGLKLMDGFTHVSTGGGASLELMSGMKLPGVEALLEKDHKKR